MTGDIDRLISINDTTAKARHSSARRLAGPDGSGSLRQLRSCGASWSAAHARRGE